MRYINLLTRAEAERRIYGLQARQRVRATAKRWAHWVVFSVFLVLALWATACKGQIVAASPGLLPTMNGVVYIQRITAPPEYATWYADMERCLGMHGDFNRVRWYVTPTPWTDGLHGNNPTYGLYWDPHRIILNAPEAHDSSLVAHEIVHDLIASNHLIFDVAHPHQFFGPDRCAYEFHP